MSTTTMHFGPEWMRTKHQSVPRSQPPPSPPPTSSLSGSGLSTYSALVSATPPVPFEKTDEAHPFRYSKEELLRIYQEGGGKGGLGLEVERWEGVVRELGEEPIALRELNDGEKKLFAGPLNSELRRRPSQSTDFLSPLNTTGLERPRMIHSASTTTNSPLRERFGAAKRRDSAGGTSDLSTLAIPRKPSLSALQSPGVVSPRDSSPRTRVGYGSNFDGVLNNGDSWVARRRASEASMKAGNVSVREVQEQAPKASGIREEKEDESNPSSHLANGEDQTFFASSPHIPSAEPIRHSSATGAAEGINASSDSSFSRNGSSTSSPYRNDRADIGPPPGLTDLAAVEWSYKDPTGQVQGPFRADLMQKWFIEGYFTADLPMKRTHVDTQWTTVHDLIAQASNENIFLNPPPPPALNRGGNSPLANYPPSEQIFNEPFQPAPIRSLRTSTLESYITGGSIASDSPSSSFGASHFGNPSPDPSAFGGRENRAYFGHDVNGRTNAFGLQDPTAPFASGRLAVHDFTQDVGNNLQGSSFGGFQTDRDLGLNGQSFNGAHIAQEPWNAASSYPNQNPSTLYHHSQSLYGHEPLTRGFNQDFAYQRAAPSDLNPLNYGQYNHIGNSSYSNIQDQQQYTPQVADFGVTQQPSHSFGLRTLDPITTQVPQNATPSIPTQSPWKALPDPSPIHGFTIPEELQPTISLSTAMEGQNNDLVPLGSTAHVEVVPSSLTVGNLGQHNQQQQKLEEAEALDLQKLALEEPAAPAVLESAPALGSDQSLPIATPAKATPKVAQPTRASPTDRSISAEPTQSAPLKSAWAKEEENKKRKGAPASISLREIQEAEAKKLESRRAAEREKEKARALATAEVAREDVQPFTASWGLPTSQAGSRGSVPVKESSANTTPTSATPPVWITTVKSSAVKKTMKEIQEEEEKRKKIVAKETPPLSASKRGYAETTTKVAAAPSGTVLPTNSPWTTVGHNGKSSSIVPGPVRPPMQASSSSYSTAGASAASRVVTTAIPKATINTAMKTRPMVKADDITETPSHDFLKWLSDSLKGLNSSVNVEEIMSMLLSFPLDADPSTLEIISDTIYANSTTLDGRRFASEFVAKRKVDATERSKGSSSAGKAPTKPVSIADVVKATPKPAQPEWGFKVVNKKKKGGRS